MAEAVAIAGLKKIGETVLGGIGDSLVDPIKRQFNYICCFNSNITELETQFQDFETTRRDVQMGADDDHRNVRVVGPSVEDWLTRANTVATEVEEIIQGKATVKEGCLNGGYWCPNLKLRYSLSRKAVKKTKIVLDHKAAGVGYTRPCHNPPPASLETIANRDFKGFESRKLKMEEIFKALKLDGIKLIGVCGMGGVGKTTLVNEVAKRAKEDNDVDEISIAVVGQEPNLTNVQACIASMLGLKNLRDEENPIVRADLLRRRLQQDNKKVLVILDDVWAEFDLQAMGIPLDGANKNLKILYTSRNQDLWHDVRTRKEIPLQLLSEDEAWQLFREKVGDSADAWDLLPIAKQIVNECGRLPLALVLIGCALSKTTGRNAVKERWEAMLSQLTCASYALANQQLSPRLQLSYEYLENEEAKHLFLLCCLFEEDEDIRVEDLVRYGLGLSLFGGMNDLENVRYQVFLIVDDLKSRYLLLDGANEYEECVKVHDVVRDMGISVAAKTKYALVSHGAISRWPKTATYEDCTAISVISKKIEELPEGLTYPKLEFLMLRCRKLKKLPPKFFEGMEKLKVLELRSFGGVLTLQSLRNLTTLSLEGFCGTLENVSLKGGIPNLEILNLRDSYIKELPEGIGELVKLRVLNLRGTRLLTRIPSGVISRLVHLEELYFWGSEYCWRNVSCGGEGMEDEVRNANVGELGGLSNLNTLEIVIDCNVVIPEVPIFGKLKLYKVQIGGENNVASREIHYAILEIEDEVEANFVEKCKRVFSVKSSVLIPPNRGGIDSLLRRGDCLLLSGEGCNDLVQALRLQVGVDGLQQLKYLIIERCDTPECLANTMNQVHLPTVFPILKALYLCELDKLREICRGPVAARSFGELTFIHVEDCERLENLFRPPIVGCLTQLKHLTIRHCDLMEQVISKENQEDIHVATNSSIVFPKLEVLKLEELPSLVGFCRGVDQIDFPKLKNLYLDNIPKVNFLFHNDGSLSSNSERNDNVELFSLFPQEALLPNLEVLEVANLDHLERLEHVPTNSFSKLKELRVTNCTSLRNMFHPYTAGGLVNLQILLINNCSTLEAVFGKEGVSWMEIQEDIHVATNRSNVFPKLEELKLFKLPSLVDFHKGIDQTGLLDQLKELRLMDIPHVNLLFGDSSNLSSNSEPNNNISLLSNFPQKVTLPKLEVLEVAGFQNLERLEHLPFSTGSLSKDSKLKEFFVHDCGKLLYVFPSQYVLMMQEFQKLTVERCDSLEVVFESEGLGSNEQSPQILCPLKFVKLRYLPKLNYISKRDRAIFKSIQTLEIDGCNSLRYVFAPTMTKSIPQLRRLIISNCEMLSSIVAEENGFGERSVDEVEFPLLKTLKLRDLPNLVSFIPDVNTTTPTKSTDQYNSPLQPQPLFNEKVAVPNLEYLELDCLENVSDLWCSLELLTNSFSKLKHLAITNCSTLEVVVGKEEQVGGFTSVSKIDKPLFPQLSSLKLEGLTNLKRFCNFNHPIEIPLLDCLDIYDCPNMDAFSLGPVSTPKLRDFQDEPLDLNTAVLLLQKKKNGDKNKDQYEDTDEDEDKDKDVDEEEEDQEGRRKMEEEKGKRPQFG